MNEMTAIITADKNQEFMLEPVRCLKIQLVQNQPKSAKIINTMWRNNAGDM